jgi:hypothetical protein
MYVPPPFSRRSSFISSASAAAAADGRVPPAGPIVPGMPPRISRSRSAAELSTSAPRGNGSMSLKRPRIDASQLLSGGCSLGVRPIHDASHLLRTSSNDGPALFCGRAENSSAGRIARSVFLMPRFCRSPTISRKQAGIALAIAWPSSRPKIFCVSASSVIFSIALCSAEPRIAPRNGLRRGSDQPWPRTLLM